MPRAFISALGNVSNRFSDHIWLYFPQLKWQNQKWCSHLTATNLSIVVAEALVVSINVITTMHWSLMCSFKIDTLVHGILTAECYCSPQGVCFGTVFMLPS